MREPEGKPTIAKALASIMSAAARPGPLFFCPRRRCIVEHQGFEPLHPVRLPYWSLEKAATGMLFLALLVVGVLYFRGLSRDSAQFWVYAITALAVIVYTYFNWRLYELQKRPVIVVIFNSERNRFELTNVGNGTALNVKFDRVYDADREPGTMDVHLRAMPPEVPVLPPKEIVPLEFALHVGDEGQVGSDDYSAAMKARYAKTDFRISGTYQDIDFRLHRFDIQAGKSGLRILGVGPFAVWPFGKKI